MSQRPSVPEATAPPSRKPSKGRLWLFRLILVFLGLVLALFLGEVALRIGGHRPMQLDAGYRAKYKQLYQVADDDKGVLYELKPLAEAEFAYRGPPIRYRINEDGLRCDRRYTRPKPVGARRILMLGDSVLFGLGVPDEELFSAQVEVTLRGVEVINGGVGGYNTYTEHVWFEAVGRSYAPDMVILCYCPNDVDDPLDHYSEHTVETLLPFPEAAVPNHDYHAKRLAQQTRSHKRSPGFKQMLKGTFGRMATWGVRHSALAHLCAQPFSYGRRSRTYERCLLATADTTSMEYAWLERHMEGIATTARKADLPVLFVYLPLAYELDGDNPIHVTSRRNVSDLAEACGFAVVDVFDTLAELDRPYLDVSHLSPAGHGGVATELVEAIRRSGRLQERDLPKTRE